MPTSARATLKAVLGQQLVEVVAGHAPRNLRKPRADQVGVPIADRAQPRVNLAAAAALRDDRVELGVAGRADGQLACRRRAGSRSSSTLSTVLPASSECVPQELLPIMPPSVQRLCVDGSGPNVS